MEKQHHVRALGTVITMKIFLYYFSIFAVLASRQMHADTPTDGWGPVTNNIQMSICLESNKTKIKANEFVRLTIRIKNLSTNMSFYVHYELGADTDPRAGVNCTVISPSGRDISPKTEKAGGGSGGGAVVGPDKVMEFAFRLGDVCKFDRHGTYRITAKKVVYVGGNKPIEVVSNTLRLPVVWSWP